MNSAVLEEMEVRRMFFVTLLFASQTVLANPHFDRTVVPKDSHLSKRARSLGTPILRDQAEGSPVLRLQVTWQRQSESYSLQSATIERSGTEAMVQRTQQRVFQVPLPLGSYQGFLKDAETGAVLAADSLGTGKEFRKLSPSLSFRFPLPTRPVLFEMFAENPQSGVLQRGLSQIVEPNVAKDTPTTQIEVRMFKTAEETPKKTIAIYAEGYRANRKEQFWNDAAKTVAALRARSFPGFASFEVVGVFAPSEQVLGRPRDLGDKILERNSFLGMYFPYWNKFGRWYHVIYPTNEERFRNALAQVAYDYPVILVDDSGYWGVGNYNVFTAIPTQINEFTYLLYHEMGHFFGLNEEYEGGGPTELEFAPNIQEPFSQNMTFLRDRSYAHLKWKEHVSAATPLPTPESYWSQSGGALGAYRGGYGDSQPRLNHKPGLQCVMDRYENFCAVCRKAIEEIVSQ